MMDQVSSKYSNMQSNEWVNLMDLGHLDLSKKILKCSFVKKLFFGEKYLKIYIGYVISLKLA